MEPESEPFSTNGSLLWSDALALAVTAPSVLELGIYAFCLAACLFTAGFLSVVETAFYLFSARSLPALTPAVTRTLLQAPHILYPTLWIGQIAATTAMVALAGLLFIAAGLSGGYAFLAALSSTLASIAITTRLLSRLLRVEQRFVKITIRMSASMHILQKILSPIRWVWNTAALQKQRSQSPTEPHVAQTDGTFATPQPTRWGSFVVRNVMRERASIVAVEDSVSYGELVQTFRDTAYSRLPVYAEDLDHIIGVVYAKDLLGCDVSSTDWRQLMRTPLFVPETRRVEDMFHDFQTQRTHFAIAVNEYGETQGIVTMEDVLEVLVGDINDEFVKPSEEVHTKINEFTYTFEGRAALGEACRAMGVDVHIFDHIRQGSESVGGLLMTVWEGVPPTGTELDIEGFRFKVLNASKQRIWMVQVTLPKRAAH